MVFGDNELMLRERMEVKRMRGQSAVEYLITYGWAILLLAIVIAGLFASGVLTPSYFISEECYLGPNLPCDFQLYRDSAEPENTVISLRFTNGFAYPITITSFRAVSVEDDGVYAEIKDIGKVDSGEPRTVELKILQPSQPGSMRRYKTGMEYYSCALELRDKSGNCPSGDDFKHQISGRIIGVVLEKSS